MSDDVTLTWDAVSGAASGVVLADLGWGGRYTFEAQAYALLHPGGRSE